jgi:hypothetical protein
MDPNKNWAPIKWPQGSFWTQPASLDLLKGAPLNSLVLPWGADATQNDQFRALISAAKERNLSLVGLLADAANPSDSIRNARSAGLSAVAMSKPVAAEGIPVIPWVPRSDAAKLPSGPVAAFTENVWPAVRVVRRGSSAGGADAGPTGAPWIDTNGWFAQLAHALHPDRTAWIVADPAEKSVISRPHGYVVPIADAATSGARWVVSLDDTFSGALATANAKALDDWKKLTATLAFFEEHRDWQTYRSLGAVGVVSDFTGDNEFMASECLNLIGRRHLPYRVVDKKKFAAPALQGLKAVVYPDDDMPAPALRQALIAFARAGGLLVCTRKCAALATGGTVSNVDNSLFQVHQLGTGRVAVTLEDVPDPYTLANEMHMLLSRRNDLYRLYNFGASTTVYQGSPDGKKALLQFLNFSGATTPDMSVEFTRRFTAARFWTPDKKTAAPLEFIKRDASLEVHLPSFAEYCAIELEA